MAAGSNTDIFGELKKVVTGVLMFMACIVRIVSLNGATGFVAEDKGNTVGMSDNCLCIIITLSRNVFIPEIINVPTS